MLNYRLGIWNAGRWARAGLVVFAAAGIAALHTINDAAAQAERGTEGLPIYDDRLGPPRSRLIDIDPPSSAAAPKIEAPAASETIALRPPTQREVASEPVAPTAMTDKPKADAPMADEPKEAVAAVAPAPESSVAPAIETPEPTSSALEAPREPAPVVPPRPEPDAEPTVTAAAESPAAAAPSPTSAPATPGAVAVLFPPGGAELPGDARPQLDSVVAALGADAAVRLQLKAYADGADGAASAARRLSLSRALAVRGYLIDAGVSSTRIDVRALGSKFETGPADRVDVISVK